LVVARTTRCGSTPKQAWDDELNKYFKGVGTPFEEPVKDEASFRKLDELRAAEDKAWERFCREN
jgi:hypothetical protein